MSATEASVRREGEALVFTGGLDRIAAVALWPTASRQLSGVQRIVLTEVASVDSAGLALLAELCANLRSHGAAPAIEGEPPGMRGLRSAYRLTPALDFRDANTASD